MFSGRNEWYPPIAAAIVAYIAATWLLNVYISKSFSFIWAMINTLQIIIHMPLMAISYPYNAFLMSKLAMAIANLDILSTDWISYLVFGIKAKD